MSLTNAIKEVTSAVQSTKFYSECNSFTEFQNNSTNVELFKMT